MGKLIGLGVQLAIVFFAIQYGLDYLKRWQNTVSLDELQQRNGIIYLPNKTEAFTGFAKAKSNEGVVVTNLTIKGGKVIKREEFYENGDKKRFVTVISEDNFTVEEWHENGKIKTQGQFKDGTVVERTFYDNGQLQRSVQPTADGKGNIWISYDRDGNKLN